MSVRVQTILDNSFSGLVIDIECHISNGLPTVIIVGYANKAVDEAKERIRSAFASSHLTFPKKRLTINLAPADVPKDSTSLDLAIAAAILLAAEKIHPIPLKTAITGELGLDGEARPVRGIVGKLLAGKKLGFTDFLVPAANLDQAALVPGVNIFPVRSLKELYLHLSKERLIPVHSSKPIDRQSSQTFAYDFAEVSGQQRAKRALEIAAAGNHNILLNGPPGTGKSMLAKALPGILPPMNQEEILEVTHLHSLSSPHYDVLITNRPFRAPHHSASDTAIVGGGKSPRPGEISLSHRGILFFDELPEFSRVALEALRQPLEDKTITISRAKDTLEFPANFLLIATANPCPCGYYGSDKPCTCMPQNIVRYQRKLSGPVMDRIDLYVEVEPIKHQQLLEEVQSAESSKTIAKRVQNARIQQQQRFRTTAKTNGDMNNRDIKSAGNLTPQAKDMLDQAATRLKISARSYMRTVKVARTIADLEDSPTIEVKHVAEALQYRYQPTLTT